GGGGGGGGGVEGGGGADGGEGAVGIPGRSRGRGVGRFRLLVLWLGAGRLRNRRGPRLGRRRSASRGVAWRAARRRRRGLPGLSGPGQAGIRFRSARTSPRPAYADAHARRSRRRPLDPVKELRREVMPL